MGNQQSQKRGLRSEAQKEEKARDAYAPIAPSNPVQGAFGRRESNAPLNEEPASSNKKRKAKTGSGSR